MNLFKRTYLKYMRKIHSSSLMLLAETRTAVTLLGTLSESTGSFLAKSSFITCFLFSLSLSYFNRSLSRFGVNRELSMTVPIICSSFDNLVLVEEVLSIHFKLFFFNFIFLIFILASPVFRINLWSWLCRQTKSSRRHRFKQFIMGCNSWSWFWSIFRWSS